MEEERRREFLRKKKFFVWCIKKYIVFSFLFIAFFSWQYGQMRKTSLQFLDQYGKIHVFSLPIKDKKRLCCLMQKLFAQDNFAYTILGSKPLSWATYHTPLPFIDSETFCNSLSKYNRILRSGWKTWEKDRHLFPSNNLWTERSKCCPGSISILLVNKERFNTVINNNIKDFQDVLCRKIVDGFELLKEAENRSLMHEILEGHQALMGIVLGYGRDNSWEFLKRSEKNEPFSCVWGEKNDSLLKGGIQIPSGIALMELYLSLYSCPSFSGDANSEESLALKKDYLLTKQKVISYYKDKDFLEATLSLLAGHRPQIYQS